MKYILNFLFLLGFSQVIFASGNPIDYGCTKPITVSLFDYAHFYNIKTKAGIDLDLIHELAKQSHCEFKIDVKPRVQIWAELESGKLDMGTAGISNPEREKFVFFSMYVHEKNFALINGNTNDIYSLNDALKLPTTEKIGIVRSFKHGKKLDLFIDHLRLEGRVVEFPDHEKVASAFTDKKIRLMISSNFSHKRLLKDELRFTDYKAIENEFDEVEAGLIISKKRFNSIQIENWNKLVQSLVKNGTIAKLSKKYL